MSPIAKTFFQAPSPVNLSASCSVLASNSATPSMDQLAYPFRKPILIEEIRWSISLASNIGGNFGAFVYARLSLGQMYLMRDPVPIWLLSPMLSEHEEEGDPDGFLTTERAYSEYRWRLPQPLYVEAGQYLLPVLSRGADGLGTMLVQTTYIGRTVAPNQPRPRIIPVPYAASFVTDNNPSGNYQQSNERHLFNPFDKPIQMQRVTGRLQGLDTSQPVLLKSLTPSTTTVLGSQMTMRMNDSWGGKMVNNFTGPGDVFDLARCAWTVDTEMPPKGMYLVEAWNLATNTRLHVGMVGTREERL